MKYVVEVIIVFVLFLVQSVFGKSFAIFGAQPDFIFLYLCYRSFENGAIHGTVLGFLLGLLQNIYSPATLGAGSLAKSIVGWILGRGSLSMYPHDLPLRLLAIFLAFLGHDFIFYLFTEPSSLIHHFFYSTLLTAVYTTTIGGMIGLLNYGMNKLLPA